MTVFGFGNAWVDTAHSAHDAAEKLQKVANSDSNDKAAVNTAAASIEAMQAAAAVAKTAQNVARSAKSAGLLGVYVSLSSHITGTEETERATDRTNRASLVRATSGDLEMLAEGAIAIRGSDVIADSGNITLQAKTGVSIESDSTSYDSSHETHQVSERHEYWNSTGIIDLPSISQTDSESDSATRTHRNSYILATKGNLTVISEADARIAGAQLIAKNTAVNVAGSLDLESKQDSERHRSKTEGYGIGLDNIFVKHQEGKQDTAWVKNQTKIIGTESVSVGADTLTLVGSMIANQTESGEDGGNLVIQVNQLNSRDLYDKDKRFDHGYAFGVQEKGFETDGASSTPSTGGSSTNTSDGTRNGGSVSVGLNESGYDREQITKATIITAFV